jgi:hypothetical protein
VKASFVIRPAATSRTESGGLFSEFRVQVLAAERHSRLSQRRFEEAEVSDSAGPTGRFDHATMEFEYLA